jgi:hypothetical protein
VIGLDAWLAIGADATTLPRAAANAKESLVDHVGGQVYARDLELTNDTTRSVNAPFLLNPANDWRANGNVDPLHGPLGA